MGNAFATYVMVIYYQLFSFNTRYIELVRPVPTGYGMTELTTVATGALPNRHKPGSVGVLVADTEGMVSIHLSKYKTILYTCHVFSTGFILLRKE